MVAELITPSRLRWEDMKDFHKAYAKNSDVDMKKLQKPRFKRTFKSSQLMFRILWRSLNINIKKKSIKRQNITSLKTKQKEKSNQKITSRIVPSSSTNDQLQILTKWPPGFE